jgi:hypothetical protein
VLTVAVRLGVGAMRSSVDMQKCNSFPEKQRLPLKFVIIHQYTWNNPPSIGKNITIALKATKILT